jgi:hypothetical protein
LIKIFNSISDIKKELGVDYRTVHKYINTDLISKKKYFFVCKDYDLIPKQKGKVSYK